MRPRHCAQYRRALTRPNLPANGIWITDSILQDAVSRYLGSHNHPRCLHALPGPLEGKRRESKRRMSGALFEVSSGQPAFPIELAGSYMNAKWLPPLKSQDRHQKGPIGPGRLFNDMLHWLEDPPPNKPFITPPDDTTRMAKTIDPTETVAVAGTGDATVTADAAESAAAMILEPNVNSLETNEAIHPKPSDWAARLVAFEKCAQTRFLEAYHTEDQHKIRNAVKKISWEALPLLQEPPPISEDRPAYVQRILHVLTEPRQTLRTEAIKFRSVDAAQLYLHEISKRFISIEAAMEDDWRDHLLFRILRLTLPPHGALRQAAASPTLRIDLDQRDTRLTDVGASDGCSYWMANIGWLAKASRTMDAETHATLGRAMNRQLRKYLRTLEGKNLAIEDRYVNRINWWLGWLLWNAYGDFGQEPGELRRLWQDYRSMGDILPEHCESHLYLIALARLDATSTLSWKDWCVLISWRDSDTRWYALTEYLMFRGQQGRKHLRVLCDFWKEMDEYDSVKGQILKSSHGKWFKKSFEGLALALGDHHMALRLYSMQQIQGIASRWDWSTWAFFAEDLMIDPSSDLTTVKQLFAFMRKDAFAYGEITNCPQAAKKVLVVEALAETVAYRAPHATPSMKWEFFNELLNLAHMLTGGDFSKTIVSLIVLSMTQLLRTGTMVSHRMITWTHQKILITHGEETASRFADTIEFERQQLLQREFQAAQEKRAKIANADFSKNYSASFAPSTRSWAKDLHSQELASVAASLGESAPKRSINRFSNPADGDDRPAWTGSVERARARARIETGDEFEAAFRHRRAPRVSDPSTIAAFNQRWDLQVQSAGLKSSRGSALPAADGEAEAYRQQRLELAKQKAAQQQRALLGRRKAHENDEGGTPRT